MAWRGVPPYTVLPVIEDVGMMTPEPEKPIGGTARPPAIIEDEARRGRAELGREASKRDEHADAL